MSYGFLPAQGDVFLLVLLAETPDQEHLLARETLERLFFARQDDDFLSLAEYYDQASYGKLRLHGMVFPWLRLPHASTFYSANRFGQNREAWPGNLAGLVKDAVEKALSRGVDFSPADNDKDGWADGLVVIHSGPDGAVTLNRSHLWSRVDYLSMMGGAPLKAGSVMIDRFAVGPEFIARGRLDALRIIAHETGHLLGLPDFYDKDRSSFGVGSFCIMGFNLTPALMPTPPAPCAYAKLLLGWAEPRIIRGREEVILKPAAFFPDLVKLETQNPHEFFLLEYRVKAGLDASLPGQGLLFYHVNERTICRNRCECKGRCGQTPLLALVQADGRNDLENKKNLGDADDFFPLPSRDELAADTGNPGDPFTGAHTLLFSGLPSGIRIKNMKVQGETASAFIITDERTALFPEKPKVEILSATWQERKGNQNGFAEAGEELVLSFQAVNLGRAAGKLVFSLDAGPMIKPLRKKAKAKGIIPGEPFTVSFPVAVKNSPKGKLSRAVASAFTDLPEAEKKEGTKTQTGVGETQSAGNFIPSPASWLTPRLPMRAGWLKPAQVLRSPPLHLDVPQLLFIADSRLDLAAHFKPALDKLGVVYEIIDVSRQGLPSPAKIAAAPVVVWLSGPGELNRSFYPDPRRLALMKAVMDSGHVLIFNAFRKSPEPWPELLEMFGLRAAHEAAGISLVKRAPGLPMKALRLSAPYYPDFNPHLELEPGAEAVPIFLDQQERVTAAARLTNPIKTAPLLFRFSAVFIGFPLEALNQESAAELIEKVISLSLNQ